ncbi:MAG: bifunctional oligoribonuclease/PAP phosphatase NrnA [Planctomycetota bacterium]
MPDADDIQTSLAPIIQLLMNHRRVGLVAHPRMDADAMGSVLGLSESLRAAGFITQPFTQGRYPDYLQFLPAADTLHEWSGREHWPHAWKPDVVVVLDIGSIGRVEPFLGSLARLWDGAHYTPPGGGKLGELPFRVINIDHHPSNESFGDAAWVRPAACSCGEMMVDLLRAAELPITREVAWNLYAAIMSDTGSFSYSNTTPRAMRIAADLIEAGADPDVISSEHYRTKPAGELKLHARILDRLSVSDNGWLAWSWVRQSDFAELGIGPENTSDLVNLVTQLATARVAVLFTEMSPPQVGTRISFRGKGYHDLNMIAHYWGGGGHVRASGATVDRPLDEVMPEVLQRLMSATDHDSPQRF